MSAKFLVLAVEKIKIEIKIEVKIEVKKIQKRRTRVSAPHNNIFTNPNARATSG